MTSEEPTPQRQNLLLYLSDYLRDNARPPAYREIERALGLNSIGAVSYHVRKLESLGYLSHDRHLARGLGLTEKAWAYLERAGLAFRAAANMARFSVVGEIAAGHPVEFEEAVSDEFDAGDAIAIDASLLPRRRDQLHAMRVRGDSMIDALVQHRDIVIMQRVLDPQAEVRAGDMVAAWLKLQQELTLKHYHPHGDMIELRPANPDFKPIAVHAANIKIQGKVLLVHRHVA